MFRISKTALLLLLLCWLPLTAQSQEAGQFKSCTRCHGQDGNSSKPPTPSISALDADYIAASMKAYQDGSRTCGFSKIKCKMASKWSAEDIAAAAQHFSALPRTRAPQEFDESLAETGKALHAEKCAGCHSQSGGADQGGLLQGQWREYLEYAMEQYGNGGRVQPEGMKAAAAGLGDGEWDALFNYYASSAD